MKATFLILFILCYVSKLPVFSQTGSQKSIRYKEKLEIAYIIDCIKANYSADSLIEWEFSSKDENIISYKYKRDRLVFFTLHKNLEGVFLQSIDYYHRSFQKTIFLNNTQTDYEINNQTRFRVWMSKDKLSVYFCMINLDNVMIWVLTNGNSVYTSKLNR